MTVVKHSKMAGECTLNATFHLLSAVQIGIWLSRVFMITLSQATSSHCRDKTALSMYTYVAKANKAVKSTSIFTYCDDPREVEAQRKKSLTQTTQMIL